jgi:hypothetical protein
MIRGVLVAYQYRESELRELLELAWSRFNVISSIMGDVQGRSIAVLFYFTIFLPFGVLSRLFSDPLRRQFDIQNMTWIDRPPVPTDLDSAKRQG